MSCWSGVFLLNWDRRNMLLNLWWGIASAENRLEQKLHRENDNHDSLTLPKFKGVNAFHRITDEPYLQHASIHDKRLKNFIAMFISVFCACMAGLMCAACLYVKSTRFRFLVGSNEETHRSGVSMHEEITAALAGLINALVIGFNDYWFRRFSVKLNTWENHRTQRCYDNHLIGKRILFMAINFYGSFFYLGYIKQGILRIPCHFKGDCLLELRSHIAYVFIILTFGFDVGDVARRGLQKLLSRKAPKAALNTQAPTKLMRHGKFRVAVQEDVAYLITDEGARIELQQVDHEVLMPAFDESRLVEDYTGLIAQYGLVVLFFAAWPLGPMVAMIHNIVKKSQYLRQLATCFRRPFPRKVENIGYWRLCLKMITFVSVVTNTATVCVTSTYLSKPPYSFSTANRWVGFFAWEHSLLVIILLLPVVISPAPRWITDLSLRHEFACLRVFKGRGEISVDLNGKIEHDKPVSIHRSGAQTNTPGKLFLGTTIHPAMTKLQLPMRTYFHLQSERQSANGKSVSPDRALPTKDPGTRGSDSWTETAPTRSQTNADQGSEHKDGPILASPGLHIPAALPSVQENTLCRARCHSDISDNASVSAGSGSKATDRSRTTNSLNNNSTIRMPASATTDDYARHLEQSRKILI